MMCIMNNIHYTYTNIPYINVKQEDLTQIAAVFEPLNFFFFWNMQLNCFMKPRKRTYYIGIVLFNIIIPT